MDRREFLKATFAASTATVALSESMAVPSAVERLEVETSGGYPLPQMVAQQREVIRQPGHSTTDLSIIAQFLMRQVSQFLDYEDFHTILAETSKIGSMEDLGGHALGTLVLAYDPILEDFKGPQRVSLSRQVSALWEAPRRFTGGRRELYDVHADEMRIGPEIEAIPVELTRLIPIARYLADDILKDRVNVFSSGLYMPKMSGSVEGAVGFASRNYGLAMRVVRCIGPEHELMMRADLLGGTFPTESVNQG